MADFDWSKAAEPDQPSGFDWATAAEPAGEPPLTETSVRGKRPPPADLNVIQAPEKDLSLWGNATGDAAVQGAAKGASFGFADELAGLGDAGGYAFDKVKNWAAAADPSDISAQAAPMGHQPASIGEAYRGGRDKYRELQAAVEGRDDSPGKLASIGGEVAGALAVPIPGPGKATGLLGAGKVIGTAAGLGGLFGLGSSQGDLTKGEYGQVAADAGKSALISGGLAGAGVAAGKGLSLLRGKAGQYAEKATEDAIAAGQKAKDKAVNSARGAWGSRSAEAIKQLENAQTLQKFGTPEEQQRAADWLASPAAAELRRSALNNSVERGQTAQQLIDKARGEFDQALERDPNVQSKEGLWDTAKRAILPRVGRVAQRVVPAGVGAAVGNTLGFPIAGTMVGGLVGAAIGHTGTTMANLVKDPNVRRHGWTAVEKVLSGLDRAGSSSAGQYLTKYAPVIASEIAQHGPEGGLAMHQYLMTSDEGYAKDVAEQVAGAGP